MIDQYVCVSQHWESCGSLDRTPVVKMAPDYETAKDVASEMALNGSGTVGIFMLIDIAIRQVTFRKPTKAENPQLGGLNIPLRPDPQED